MTFVRWENSATRAAGWQNKVKVLCPPPLPLFADAERNLSRRHAAQSPCYLPFTCLTVGVMGVVVQA
ncbi:hypothetical protein XELAEV_18009610mg [Xenopus laevis]|uniref:Uncharacterized protein n=1 Tax=Xenopus laevis TaxID=8355 RepID=A0A974DSP6_XENLA|nr:hypothetical protein XELAEV_18009610mg [Xenopus laevis]